MMSFGELMEHVSALTESERARIAEAGGEFTVPPLSESQVFFLGDEEKASQAVREVGADVLSEMRDHVPIPFKDTTVVMASEDDQGVPYWSVERLMTEHKFSGMSPELMHGVVLKPGLPAKAIASDGSVDVDGFDKIRQRIFVWQYGVQDAKERTASLLWEVFYYGAGEQGTKFGTSSPLFCAGGGSLEAPLLFGGAKIKDRSDRPKIEDIFDRCGPLLTRVAAISHPANYIVRVTPKMTPREERRTASGKRYPAQKTPHFVVVDHEVLVQMNPRKPVGTHASPVPHHRRGHWKRLSERCRHARMLGREKAWVRPAYVGETKFSDHRHHYEVILDFKPCTQTQEARA